jgi:hypothetical protein
MILTGRAVWAWASGLLALLALVALVGAGEARAENFVVSNTEDAGPGSLRVAIEGANAALAPPHVIDATGVAGTIGLATALPALTADVTILGPGARVLTVRRQDGALPFRIFTIEGAAVTLSDLTISNGFLPTENGGGIHASAGGSVAIRRSVVSGNTAERGGGVYLAGTAGSSAIERSTIAGNAALYTSGGGNGGGGINNMTALTIDTSTVSGNTTGGSRGAGLVTGGNMLTAIVNSTFADNGGSGNIFAGSSGDPTMTVRSTIVADARSLEEGNCQTGGGATIDSNGHNLVDDDSCGFEQPTDQESTDPLLGALGDNGGPTPTQALGAGSPAVDRGVAGGTTTDQRGLPRPFDFTEVANAANGDGADIGAFELHPPPPPPPAGPGPTPGDTTVTLRIRGGKLPLSRRGKVKVRVTCPPAEQSPPCRGKLTLRTRARVELGGRKRFVVLATSRFSVAAGKTARLSLTLPPAKLELLRTEPRARRVLAIAGVRDGAGNRATVRKRLRVTLGSPAQPPAPA